VRESSVLLRYILLCICWLAPLTSRAFKENFRRMKPATTISTLMKSQEALRAEILHYKSKDRLRKIAVVNDIVGVDPCN
jgi:hypothetical protein